METARATYSPWFRAGQVVVLALFAAVASSFLCGSSVAIEDAVKGIWLAVCAALVLLWMLTSHRWIEIDEEALRTKRWLTGRVAEYPVSDIRAAIPVGLRAKARRANDAPRAAAVRIRFSNRRSLLVFKISHRGFDAFVRSVQAIVESRPLRNDHGEEATAK